MDIAIYGGKFDPPHRGHLNVALQVLKKLPNIDELWLIPAKTHQWRDIYVSGKDRLAMLKTYCRYDSRIKICDIELRRRQPTTTIDTVRQLRKLYPKDHFVFVMGSDNVATFHLWNDYRELSRLIKFIIYPRPGFQATKLPKNFFLIPDFQAPKTIFSSSVVRQRLAQGKSVRSFLTPEVAKCIQDRNLYQT